MSKLFFFHEVYYSFIEKCYTNNYEVLFNFKYRLGSMTSLDSRPSTPPPAKRSSEDLSNQKHEAVSSPDPTKFKKFKTKN